MATLSGKVALVTGAARGQGRSHAVRLAEAGAEVIAIDLCATPRPVAYPGATREDLDETAREVETSGRRVVAAVADVRDPEALGAAVRAGVEELGRLDIVCANAGIWAAVPPAGDEPPSRYEVWRETLETNLTGAWNTIEAALPAIRAGQRGGAIVITSATSGLKGAAAVDGSDPHSQVGQAAYNVAEHGVVGLMRTYALELAPESIRVNSIHPTDVNTPLRRNPAVESFLGGRPELDEGGANAMPVAAIAPRDVSAAILFLVSDAARYVTGVTLPVDAGRLLR